MLVKSFISGPTPQKILEHEDYKKYTKKLAQLAGPKIHLHNDVDEEPCPPLGFEFITELKLGRGVNPWSDEFSSGCDCKNGCKKGCNCIEILPDGFGNLSYKNGLVIHDSDFVIYECNPMCSCGPGCQNSVVGRGRQHEFEIFKTALKGWGLRCREPLKKGTFIGLYLGEVVNPEEASKRAKMGDEMKLSYLFDLDKFNKDDQENRVDDSEDELSKGMGEDHKDSYAIDGRECGTYTRFINHSCDPNCVAYAVVSGRRDLEVYDLAMFTARNIAPFEELSFEYTMEDDHIPSASIKDTSKCHCGAANCRGFLW
ncbi:hypothetical protein EDC01DRAFT_718816 [Geopyxis carbonaria]|nr:hypothetical protein EDC01DRAFT_718816 [Geopyxis carbonaria]